MAWICSWICHYDWEAQITAEAADAEMPGTVVHEAMEHDKEPDTMEFDAGPKVLCHYLLAWALLC